MKLQFELKSAAGERSTVRPNHPPSTWTLYALPILLRSHCHCFWRSAHSSLPADTQPLLAGRPSEMAANIVTKLVFGVAVDFEDVLITAKAWKLQMTGRLYLTGMVTGKLQQGSQKLPREVLVTIREQLWSMAIDYARGIHSTCENTEQNLMLTGAFSSGCRSVVPPDNRRGRRRRLRNQNFMGLVG